MLLCLSGSGWCGQVLLEKHRWLSSCRVRVWVCVRVYVWLSSSINTMIRSSPACSRKKCTELVAFFPKYLFEFLLMSKYLMLQWNFCYFKLCLVYCGWRLALCSEFFVPVSLCSQVWVDYSVFVTAKESWGQAPGLISMSGFSLMFMVNWGHLYTHKHFPIISWEKFSPRSNLGTFPGGCCLVVQVCLVHPLGFVLI